MITVSARLRGEHRDARPPRGRELDPELDVEQQEADPGEEVVQVGPDQPISTSFTSGCENTASSRTNASGRGKTRTQSQQKQRDADEEERRARSPGAGSTRPRAAAGRIRTEIEVDRARLGRGSL